MHRRSFLRSSAGALLGAARPVSAQEFRTPNILFLLADQWRAQTLPSSGDPDLIAPGLQRLAREGVHFNRAYAANPVCSPARAALLTGRFPHSTGVVRNNIRLDVEARTLSGELLRAGYATGYIGKWHLDGDAKPGFVPPGLRRHGFQYWAAFNRGHNYYDSVYFLDDPEPLRGEGFEPDYQTALAIDFIRRHRAQPFLLVVSWGPPHTPRKPPPQFAQLYRDRSFRLRPNVPAGYAATARRNYAGYYGLCSALDANIVRLLNTLDENNLADDTIVVFTSDHGDMLGSHGLEFKGLPYEESARIPLLVRYRRRLRGGQVSDLPVSGVDLMPTLLALAGVSVPAGVQGRDLSALILHGAGPRPESIYVQGRLGSRQEWRMVVRGLDKLVADTDLNVTHLYNLGQDPYEMDNLAANPDHRRKRDEMQAILRDWMRRTGDRILPSGLRLRG